MKQLGTVLVFKKGTSRQQAEDALQKIEELLDPSYTVITRIYEFDDQYGCPVWYIP